MKFSKFLCERLVQPPHLLHLMLEDLPAVVVAEAAARHHPGHSLRLEENLREVDDGLVKGVVSRDLGLSLEEALGRIK